MLSVVKLLLKGEVGVCALNSHRNYIVESWKIMEKSWNCVLNFELYVLSPLSCAKTTTCYPKSLNNINTCSDSGSFDVSVLLSVTDKLANSLARQKCLFILAVIAFRADDGSTLNVGLCDFSGNPNQYF